MDELYSVGEHVDLATIAVKVGTDSDFQVELLLLCVKGLMATSKAQERRIYDLEEALGIVRAAGVRLSG